MSARRDLRKEQCCPNWCNAGDHEAESRGALANAGTEIQANHRHIVGEARSIVVLIEKPLSQGWPVITVNRYTGSEVEKVRLSMSEARSVAAMLVRAADLGELDG